MKASGSSINLLEHPTSKNKIIYDGSDWFVESDAGSILINTTFSREHLSLLPFLELNINYVIHELRIGLRASGISWRGFPFHRFIAAAFEQGSEGWIFFAIGWLLVLDASIARQFQFELKNIENNRKRYSKDLRDQICVLRKRIDQN